jgi:N-acetylmuramoyl-L-alanine amidase
VKTLVLDPGHGGHDPGAVGSGIREKDVVLDIARAVYARTSFHCIVLPTRISDLYIPLWRRAGFANVHKADLFISIHCNADPDDDSPGQPIAKGEEIWVHPGSVKGKEFALLMQEFTSLFASTHRGIKESDKLAVLRLTKMPAVLMEVGFVDNPRFARMPPVQEAARAISESALVWFDKEK